VTAYMHAQDMNFILRGTEVSQIGSTIYKNQGGPAGSYNCVRAARERI